MANPSTFGQPTWGRWTPHPQPQQYTMMGNHQEQMYYGSPPESPDMMPGQMIPQQYTIAPQYAPAYSSAPGQTQGAPVPHHLVMPYTGYDGLADMSSPSPIKQEPRQHFEQIPHPGMQQGFYGYPHRDVKPSLAALSPPSSRRGSQASMMVGGLSLTTPSKTIKANKTYNPSDDVSFNTPVDQMMKILDPEPKTESQLPTPGSSPKCERPADCSTPASPCGSATISTPSPSVSSSTQESKAKKYYCDGPDCNAVFHQKVHLKTHKATHTGEKPYKCPHCPATMSQAGNLNTHINNHLGIRNFRCRFCPKDFGAKGNCAAHERNIHGQRSKIPCQLDQCTKEISTIGNLKTHTNKYHAQTVRELATRFAQFPEGYVPEEDRALYDYFRMIFKNSNKGVKGRGKGRKVIKINESPRKASKVAAGSDRRSKSHRDISSDNNSEHPRTAAVAAHLADRQRYYGV